MAAFLVLQYALALWKLGQSSGGMMNKFSALAREQYLGFLVMQNLWMLAAYVLLGIGAFLLARPVVDGWTRRSPRRGHAMVMLRGFTVAAVLHGFFTLRLAQTRPYFLNEAEFGHWYYKMIEFPDPVRPAALFAAAALPRLCHRMARAPPRAQGMVGGGWRAGACGKRVCHP
ncbi:MAG: hypothetical protein MUC40_01585 [Akkermansiaceae bacterium]|nr:hypothetical protein [Akkermansiaceae bacterium]